MKFAIIGCSKSKLLVPCPAKDLYQGDLFKLSRRYVESLGIPYGILSASHGLVHPDRFLEPYDTGIVDLSRAEKQDLCVHIDEQLRWQFPCRLDDFGNFKLKRYSECLFLAGNGYWSLMPVDFGTRYNVERPLINLGIGQQKHWLRVNTKAAA